MNKRIYQAVISIFVVLFLVALYFFTRPRDPVRLDSGYREVMGTFARIIAIAADSKTAKKSIEAAFAEIRKVDELMSDYKSDSQISRINRDGFGQAVPVSQSTFHVLQRSIKFSKLSEGAFDITIGPVVDLWRSSAEANSIPTPAELRLARSKVGYEKIILDANELTVRLAVDGMRLDLGGIAKGYAIDRAVEAMQQHAAIGAMVDIGGDIRCFGTPPKGRDKWLIGLQDPNVAPDDISTANTLLVLNVTDAAVATSGGYRRFTLIEGKKYGHIFDTKTACSSDELTSVTIISKDALTADALATSVSVMGPEKGLALIEKIPQTEAILIPGQDPSQLIKTSGAEKYVK